MEQRSWGFKKVSAEDCFDNYSWWKDKSVKGHNTNSHGVYAEEPHLLSATLSASMSEPQKFGTYFAVAMPATEIT